MEKRKLSPSEAGKGKDISNGPDEGCCNSCPQKKQKTLTPDATTDNAKSIALNSQNLDLLDMYLSPSSKNIDELVSRSTSSQSTISDSSGRSSAEEVDATASADDNTIASASVDSKVSVHSKTPEQNKKGTKTKKSLSPRPPSLKINIKPASDIAFERPIALLTPIKTPVSVRSQQATQLHRAVLSGNIAEVEAILKATGFSLVNKQDDHGYTALMSAAALSNAKAGLSICKVLLRENAAVDLSDHEGFTAFHWASAVGNDDICVFLATETDIDVNAKSMYTALKFIVLYRSDAQFRLHLSLLLIVSANMNDAQFQKVKSEIRRYIAHLDLAWQIQSKLLSRNVAPRLM